MAAAPALERLSSNKSFEGDLLKYKFKVFCHAPFSCHVLTLTIVSRPWGPGCPIQSLYTTGRSAEKCASPYLPRWSYLLRRQRVGQLICLRALDDLIRFSAQKGNFLKAASAEGIAILFPDTSPRGAGAPHETDSWDFGVGAGFYLNATKSEYSKNYNMLAHVTTELPQVIEAAGLPIVCLG
jgi:S-formylglutathione hydrolase